jgi:hypothetical protein
MGRLAGSAAPVDLGAGVGLRRTAEAAMLAAVQPAAASGATLLTVGGSAAWVLLAVRAGARAADEPAGMVARALAGVLAGTCTAVRLVAVS